MSVPDCLDDHIFVIHFEIRSVSHLTLYFFFNIVLTILSPLDFHIHFRIQLIDFCKKDSWDYDWDCIESVDLIGVMVVLPA